MTPNIYLIPGTKGIYQLGTTKDFGLLDLEPSLMNIYTLNAPKHFFMYAEREVRRVQKAQAFPEVV